MLVVTRTVISSCQDFWYQRTLALCRNHLTRFLGRFRRYETAVDAFIAETDKETTSYSQKELRADLTINRMEIRFLSIFSLWPLYTGHFHYTRFLAASPTAVSLTFR